MTAENAICLRDSFLGALGAFVSQADSRAGGDSTGVQASDGLGATLLTEWG
jgi:hypothetical protein